MRSLHDGPAKKKDKVLCATTISRDREISAALTVASELEYLFRTSGVRALPLLRVVCPCDRKSLDSTIIFLSDMTSAFRTSAFNLSIRESPRSKSARMQVVLGGGNVREQRRAY